jgi:uncharacterized protein
MCRGFSFGANEQMRAYSLLEVKTIDEERRLITGIASTPTMDRVGDEVMPMGAKFATPMPLLLYHNPERPVGNVDFAKPTKKGIPFKASLPNVVEEGIVRDRVLEAWHSLKYKLVAAVSIGFRGLEGGVEMTKTGLRFNAWEWLELSLVSIPAQPEAVIQSFKSMDRSKIHALLGTHPSDTDAERQALIKSLDTQVRAASGHTRKGVALIKSPDVSGQQRVAHRGPVKLIPRSRKREEVTS